MQYSVKGTDGNTYGPVDLITLKQWVQEGRVLPNAQVTDNLSNRTMQASQMPELGLSAGPTNPYANAPVPPANYNPYPRDGQMHGQPRDTCELLPMDLAITAAPVIH